PWATANRPPWPVSRPPTRPCASNARTGTGPTPCWSSSPPTWRTTGTGERERRPAQGHGPAPATTQAPDGPDVLERCGLDVTERAERGGPPVVAIYAVTGFEPVKAPVLVLNGEKDTAFRAGEADFARAHPHARRSDPASTALGELRRPGCVHRRRPPLRPPALRRRLSARGGRDRRRRGSRTGGDAGTDEASGVPCSGSKHSIAMHRIAPSSRRSPSRARGGSLERWVDLGRRAPHGCFRRAGLSERVSKVLTGSWRSARTVATDRRETSRSSCRDRHCD